MTITPKTNCAGQACSDRERCRRYQLRISSGKEVVCGVEMPVFEWASLDIERQHFGDCSQFIRFYEPK